MLFQEYNFINSLIKFKNKNISIINCMCPKLKVKTAEQSTLDVFNINLKGM